MSKKILIFLASVIFIVIIIAAGCSAGVDEGVISFAEECLIALNNKDYDS